ncbi:hypothetical protein NQ318_012651 [Aromia moschata]|uniref:DUF4817 domain-containing protein n=1 Tax=Aromia moschata TaxID=1265417 RepID=A0AAV8X6P5_9CUCU|nr:hypothetical protein NQ318_012651 [Aromia moschata]
MLGYGDRRRSHSEVCTLFNEAHPKRPIVRSTVTKIVAKFQAAGHVRDLPKSGRPPVPENTQLDVMFKIIPIQQLAKWASILILVTHRFVLIAFQHVIYFQYLKVQLEAIGKLNASNAVENQGPIKEDEETNGRGSQKDKLVHTKKIRKKSNG